MAVFTVSSSQASPATSAKPAHLAVGVQVLKMTPAAGRKLNGAGLVTATLTNNAGQTQTTHSKVAFTAAAGKSCQILNQLHLSVLGLVVDLNKVHLTVTATQGGGLLGNLFCSLSTTTVPVPTTPTA
jgi:hypothetical protein